MTDTHDKFRALILSALMVLSVFAGTVALTGSAAADTFAETDADVRVSSGATFYQGQEVFVNATGSATDDDTLDIRPVQDDGDLGNSVGTAFLDSADHNGTFDTSNLDGSYVLTNSSHIIAFNDDGTVDAANTVQIAGATETEAESADWGVSVQSLSTSFDDDDLPISTGETATIEVDSNRATFTVNVTAENLDEGDLEEIFNQSADQSQGQNFIEGTGADDDDDDSVQIQTRGNGDIEANFTEFDEAGSYTFNFEVNDTEVTSSASVDVAEEDVTLDFSQGVYTQQEGDIAAITISMEDASEAWLWVGSDDVNYLERVHVEDDDDDGRVTVLMNTRWVGTVASSNDADSDSDGDNSSASGDATMGYGLLPDSDDVMGDVERFNDTDFTDDLDRGIQSEAFDNDNPLEPADYDLTVSSSATAPSADDDGELVIEDEEDVATLDLTERSTDGINTFVAPTGNADADVDDDEEVQEVLDSMTASDTVAVGSSTGDQLIVQVNASGVGGYVFDDAGFGGPLNQLSGGTTPWASGIYLNVSEQGGNNRESSNLNLAGGDAQVIEGGPVPADTFLAVIDTRDFSNMDNGDTYDVEFQVGNEDFSDSPNPYVDDESQELVSTELSLQDTDASFDNVVDSQVQVAQGSNATVSGTTNAAPGEEISVRLRKTGENPFLLTQTVTVADDGTFSAQFDTSDVPVDTTFTATVREGSTTLGDEMDGVIVEQQTETPTPTETETATPTETETATPTETEMEGTPTETEAEATPTETDTGGQPGFGVAIAIVALLGAALLALRRRD